MLSSEKMNDLEQAQKQTQEKIQEQERENDWVWKKFTFEKGTLYITSDAKKLDSEEIQTIFEDGHSFMQEKPEKLHTGSDGSVYVLKSGSYILKEQKSDGKELMKEHEKWKKYTQNDSSFPENIRFIDYVALIEPPYLPEDEWGRRKQKISFDNQQTDVAVGAGAFTRKADICSYVLMPFVGDGVDLGKLKQYQKDGSFDNTVNRTVEILIEKGIISDASQIESFVDEQFKKIQGALEHSSEGNAFDMRDFAHRNIVIDVSEENPQFYLIDL
ncbi:MAG: hypothetical protein IPN70_01730 [Candidatus Moraniibacteriota bacterium]|nr:MAG: hypothetical protein IPN70_01730 [Candidatus Moranbacteria bacterium]